MGELTSFIKLYPKIFSERWLSNSPGGCTGSEAGVEETTRSSGLGEGQGVYL